ncbi:hypothetical protein AWJ20_923 [Sugiyamaella lignohabitans]|uniref:Gylcosyl hydrolase 115 C-terminal domain-containing protein n=1 Tax=Sugiyamaella lignohabitans TaxID=796027 RepID=A0A167D9Y8_9ASCO|nr:uncharacterized protein AWJ20_923 [Sugiyamaella lignohabitans]ANB12661.1 hypothetical protein AWJ20_923 [Sugiyamaella lignohabitans]
MCRMRGFDDFEMDLDREDAIKVVQSAVKAQREILKDANPEKSLNEIPQMWCIYKEVMGYYEGGMPVPDDVTLLWSDDNWGNIRRLPLPHELEREGGAGLYYHFDYVGDPRDYKWLNTVSLQRTYEQLHLAYQRQADKVWILNVGDLKPLELPINYYFDLAYDINRWSYDNIDEWTLLWAEREFGKTESEEIAYLADTFSKYAAWRKFELVDVDTFSILNYNEAEIALAKWAKLEERAEKVNARLPESKRAAFFQMILHPIKAGHVVYQIYINAAKNYLYVEQKRSSSNRMAFSVFDLLKADKQLTDDYHDLLDGKWNHMMDQTHLGYNYWQQPMRDALPPVRLVQDQMDALAGTVGIGIEGSYATVPGDDRYHELGGKALTTLPMDPYGPSTRYVDIFSRERKCSKWELKSEVDYVTITPSSGTVCGTDSADSRAHIHVDWTRAPAGSSQVKVAFSFVPSDKTPRSFGGTHEGHMGLYVPLNNTKIPTDYKDGFIESDRHVSIEAEHYSKNTSSDEAHYVTIPNFGHTLSGVTLYPVLAGLQHAPSSPYLEYDIYTFSPTTLANITVYTAPSLNFNGEGRPLKYAIAVDDETPKIVQVVPSSEYGQLPEGWEEAVSNNYWTPSSSHLISPGAHKIKVWAVEPGVVFQKLVVDLGGVRDSYFGPPESRRAGQKKEEEEQDILVPVRLRIPNREGQGIPERDGARHGNNQDETTSDSTTTPNLGEKKGTPKSHGIFQTLRGSLRLDQKIFKGATLV